MVATKVKIFDNLSYCKRIEVPLRNLRWSIVTVEKEPACLGARRALYRASCGFAFPGVGLVAMNPPDAAHDWKQVSPRADCLITLTLRSMFH
ncbi:hypothetical protein MPLSOD_340160 [Mesorhizobium sp. SOD10]|nr:hypothetical protein MPLSOD_340160 [Mesorhizobium sp. SOD10]